MKKANVHYVMGVVMEGGRAYVESRARAVSNEDGPLPPGKMLVSRTPILPPGATEKELSDATETWLVDVDSDADAGLDVGSGSRLEGSEPCPLCADEMPFQLQWLGNESP